MIIFNIEKFLLGLMIFMGGIVFMLLGGMKVIATVFLFVGLSTMWSSWTKIDPNTPVRI